MKGYGSCAIDTKGNAYLNGEEFKKYTNPFKNGDQIMVEVSWEQNFIRFYVNGKSLRRFDLTETEKEIYFAVSTSHGIEWAILN